MSVNVLEDAQRAHIEVCTIDSASASTHKSCNGIALGWVCGMFDAFFASIQVTSGRLAEFDKRTESSAFPKVTSTFETFLEKRTVLITQHFALIVFHFRQNVSQSGPLMRPCSVELDDFFAVVIFNQHCNSSGTGLTGFDILAGDAFENGLRFVDERVMTLCTL
jgi:hypothetical protein